MKIFITGATGFIGKHLIPRLLKENHQLTVLVRSLVQKKELEKIGVKVVVGNIKNQKTFISELSRAKVIIHLAAIRSNWGLTQEFMEVNARSVKNLFVKNSSVDHIIVTSSVYALGKLNKLPANEKTPLLAADIYGKSKILLEEITKEQSAKFNIPYTIIRPAIVYGPFDNNLGMIVKMISLIKINRFPFIGNGKNLLHLIYIDDLVEGYLKAIKKGGNNQIYILAAQTPITLGNLVDLIKKYLKLDFKKRSLPKPPLQIMGWVFELFYRLGIKIMPNLFKNEPPISTIKVQTISENFWFDIKKAQKELNFRPKVDYDKGIEKTIKWYDTITK